MTKRSGALAMRAAAAIALLLVQQGCIAPQRERIDEKTWIEVTTPNDATRRKDS